MGLFKKKSEQTLTLQQLIDFLNLNGAEKSELSEATYFACLKILSESVGKLPLKLLQHTEKGGVIKAYKHHLYNVLSNKPNPYMTATHFWSTVEYARNHYGNAYVWITGAGTSTTLWYLPPESVEVWIDDRGIFGSENALWYIYNCEKNGKRYKIPYDSIMHFKSSASLDGVKGIAVRDQLSETISGGIKSQKMLTGLFENAFTAKAVVQYTGALNDSLVQSFAKNIEEYAAGKIEDVKRVIPIPVGTTLTPLNTNLADNQFIELKKYSALQIAAAFGIKPNQINDYEKSSYASAEAQQLAFYVDTLLYILKQYEEEISNKLLSDEDVKNGFYPKFNVAVILRADLKTQIQSLRDAVQGTLYTPNEARALLDQAAVPGGDVLLCNGTMLPIEKAGAAYQDKGGD